MAKREWIPMNKLTLIWILLTFSLTTVAEDTPLPITDIEEKILHFVNNYNAPGLSVAVVKNNEVIFIQGFGFRDNEKKLPVDTQTAFHIASMTKAFTGALVGQLASENRLKLSDKPSIHIPKFQFFNAEMDQRITIGDLLSLKSSIGDHGLSLVLFPMSSKTRYCQVNKRTQKRAIIRA